MGQDLAFHPAYVVKRDGEEVPFDPEKISGALSRCYAALGCQAPVGAVAAVVSVLVGKYGQSVPVERVQDTVETVLLSFGERDAAKAYMAYRDAHAERRRLAIVTPELRAAYEAGATAMGNDPLRTFQFFDKYSRWNGERRETWPECVDRAVEHLRWLVVRECGGDRFTEGEWLEISDAIRACDALPSMRLLSQAGVAARRDDVAIFNCAYQAVTDLQCFAESLLISMAGCGDAYSVESKFVRQLPFVKHQRGGSPDTYVIPDDSQGWASALLFGLERWFDGGDVVYDYSGLRPAGAILRTKGGRSSGPTPLRSVLRAARALVLSRQGSQLSTVDANDLMCITGEAGNSGGQRRTAKLSLSDWGDAGMQAAKGTPGWWDSHGYRANANNSAVWPDGGPSQMELVGQMHAMYLAASGERGIFSRENSLRWMPPQRAEFLRRKGAADSIGTNPCLTGETLVAVADGRGHIPIRVLAEAGTDVPVFCLDNANNITVRVMRHPRITGRAEKVLKVGLDDGSFIRVTEGHKFLKTDGNYIEAKDLTPGDSLGVMTKDFAAIKDVFPGANSRSQKYAWLRWIGKKRVYAEHRLIVAHAQNIEKVPRGHVVHHKDYNALNNLPENLQIMTREAHDELHRHDKIGEKNPMARAKHEWSAEKWADYRAKHSKISAGNGNANATGATHAELREHALAFTKTLGRRFSHEEWYAYAQPRGIPVQFSKWRKDHLGGLMGLSKWAAAQLGYEHGDLDPRIQRRYLALTAEGYDCEITDDKKIVFRKSCEICEKPFIAASKEIGICSHLCVAKKLHRDHGEKMRVNMLAAHETRKEAVRLAQVKIFLDVRSSVKRMPLKKEWMAACRTAGVSPEIARKSSPFTSWEALRDNARATNHRVVSVEADGLETVYNGTVDEFHNFFVGGFATDKGFAYLNNKQCGEIILQSRQFCNLSIAVARPADTVETLRRKLRIATIIGTIQSLATHYPYLRAEWSQNSRDERLLGTDITGQMDCPLLRGDSDASAAVLREMRAVARTTNETYAVRLGITPSHAITANKPSGNSSAMLDCSPGINSRKMRYGIRNARVSAHSPIFRVLKACGVPMDPENGQQADTATKWVIHFPMRAPDGSVVESERSALQQLDHWLLNKMNYTEHNPSVTVTYSPDEMIGIIEWLWHYRDRVGGLSFLPRANSVYRQMPYEETTREEYERALAAFPRIDWALIAAFEAEDMTTSSQELACSGGKCEAP